MTLQAFNNYMNNKFDEMINRLCPTGNNKKEQ